MFKNMKLFFAIGLIVSTLGCSTTSEMTRAQTLYDQLGKLEGITNIVDNTLFEMGDDEEIMAFYENTDIVRFREKLIEQVCEASDGPCVYTGGSMPEVHASMNIEKRHFDTLVGHFIEGMKAAGTPEAAQNELLGRLAPLYDQIVNARDYL